MQDEQERLDALAQDLALLRQTVLRQGHAQELFQARVEGAVGRLGAVQAAPPPGPSHAQVRALLELDQALLQILRLAEEGSGQGGRGGRRARIAPRGALPPPDPRPRSPGLEVIPTQSRPFDDAGTKPVPWRTGRTSPTAGSPRRSSPATSSPAHQALVRLQEMTGEIRKRFPADQGAEVAGVLREELFDLCEQIHFCE